MKTAIIGAGISGLATAQAIISRNPQAEVTVFEASPRAGGKVITEMTPEGYLCEWGVNGFLSKSPRTLELADEVGLRVLPADESAKKRYVFSEGALHQLPEKPPQFFTSNLLSVPGRLRVIGEVFSGRAKKEDETLAEFGTRHLGREAFEKLIDPMASGVFAGNAEKMSLKSCFPRIHEVESEYGSLIRGLIKLQKAARKEGKKDKPGPGPGGILTSFGAGMSELTDTLASLLGNRVRLSTPVSAVTSRQGRYTAHLAEGADEEFENVVMAAPAWAQSTMLKELAPEISEQLDAIEYPALAVVCMGFDRTAIGPGMDGFGFLVPSREKRGILGTVADSNVFGGRAPQGKILLRTMVGGARSPHLARLEDAELLDLVCSDLKDIMGVGAEPEFAQIYRHERAIPQYLRGHAKRLEKIGEELKKHAGLLLTGNAYRGVSLNDCVLNAEHTAGKLFPAVD